MKSWVLLALLAILAVTSAGRITSLKAALTTQKGGDGVATSVIETLQAEVKLQKKATKQAAKAATKAKTASLSVFHPGQKDPLAYEALEDHVNMLKQQEAQNTAKIQQELAKKMSARKGGDQQVQELLTVLPASFGPVGRRKTYIRPVTEAQGFNNMIN